MKVARMSFDGALLNRGFWIYVITIARANGAKYLYVGRTGDNSTPNAAAPFRRVFQHLDLSPNARANSLTRLIGEKGASPSEFQFSLVAVGPIFPEQDDFESHRPFRDRMTALEKAVSDHFRNGGYQVLGKHDDNDAKDPVLAKQVIKELEAALRQ